MISPLDAIRLKTALQRRAAELHPPLAPPRGFTRLTPIIGRAAHRFLYQYLERRGVNPRLGFQDPRVHNLLFPVLALPGSLGIDVSNNNGVVNWQKVPTTVRFAFAKVSEGRAFIDAYWPENHSGAKRRGVPIGGYHFAHIGRGVGDATAQADFFCSRLGQQPGMLRPVIDWEAPGCDNPANLDELVAMALRVERHTGKVPILYGSAYSFRNLKVSLPSPLVRCPLWIAAYPNLPPVPAPWRSVAVHQYTDAASIPGVSGKCDASRLQSPLSEIQ